MTAPAAAWQSPETIPLHAEAEAFAQHERIVALERENMRLRNELRASRKANAGTRETLAFYRKWYGEVCAERDRLLHAAARARFDAFDDELLAADQAGEAHCAR